MGRYILHLQNQGLGSENAKDLLLRARTLEKNAVIRDARISSRYLEFDISIEREGFQSVLEKLGAIAPVARFTEVREGRIEEKDETIEQAKQLFDEERYWECHEVLEGAWKKESAGSEKKFLQGLILTCAGFVHAQKDEPDICLSVLGRAREKLGAVDGVYHGIDTEKFRQEVGKIIGSKDIRYFKIR